MPLVSKTFSQIITFTRASTATFFDSAGVLQSAAIDAPRFDYDPSTLAARGLLIEEARTNGIRNNTMQGAVAGTPGTVPTNWDVVISGSGITREIVGTGTEDGITYIDMRFSGTGSGTAIPQIRPETTTQIVAAAGQTWTASYYLRVVGGSTAGIASFASIWQERDASGVTLNSVTASITAPTTAALKTQRFILTRTLTDAGTARLTNRVQFTCTDGVPVDITFRIGLPQLELGEFATSVIETTTTALTRAADVASVNTLSPWFNSASGTFYVEATTPPGLAGFPNSIGISDGTINNRTLTYVFTNGFYSGITTGGVSQGNAPVFVTPTIGAASKFAAAYNTNLLQSALNGTAGTPDTTINLPSGLNIMRIGAATLSSNFYNSHIQRITYYPRAFSQTELQTLTT
jgi:hypothetical protein